MIVLDRRTAALALIDLQAGVLRQLGGRIAEDPCAGATKELHERAFADIFLRIARATTSQRLVFAPTFSRSTSART